MQHLKLNLSIILILLMSIFSASVSAEQPDPADVMELHRQAREMFRKANELSNTDPQQADQLYRKAVMRFEKIAWQAGIRNGKLFYNIGNTYFKLGDIGRSILNYKRAARYIPNDLNLRQNLQYAKAKRVDRIEEPQTQQALKILFFWHYDFSSHTRLLVFTLFFVLFWLVAAIRLFVSKSFLTWSMVFLAGLFILFLGSLIVEAYAHHHRPGGVIIDSEVVARKGNSLSYEKSFKDPLHAGTEFVLLEKRGAWYHVELMDARRCWLPEAAVEMVVPEDSN